MQTKLDIGVFERPVTLKWALVRLKHHVVTSPVTSPQKRKHEIEIIPTKLSRFGSICLKTLEPQPKISQSDAFNLKIWARTVEMVMSYDFFSFRLYLTHIQVGVKTRDFDGDIGRAHHHRQNKGFPGKPSIVRIFGSSWSNRGLV